MAVFCPVNKQRPVSGTHRQISRVLQVYSPDFCLCTFKGRALWHRSPVYISTALEGKKWHEFFNAPCAVARSPGLLQGKGLQFHLLWAHCDWLQRVLEEADSLWVKKSSWANWAGQEKLIVYLFVNMLTVNLPFFSIRILYPAVQLFAN